jgi:hypothetical protein
MPYIAPPTDATLAPAGRAQLDAFAGEHGHFAELRAIFAHFPTALTALDNQYSLIMGRGALDRWVREAVFAICADARGDTYLAAALTAQAIRHGADAERLNGFLTNAPDIAPVGDGVDELIRFSRKMALEPYKSVDRDARSLYEAGWSNAHLVEVLTVVSLSAYMDIMTLSLHLGHTAEPGRPQWL